MKRALEDNSVFYRELNLLKRVEAGSGGLKITWEEVSGEWYELVDCLLVAIGREPNISCLKKIDNTELVRLEEEGSLFRIGDLNNGNYRQTSIAVGDGVRAAMRVAEYLEIGRG